MKPETLREVSSIVYFMNHRIAYFEGLRNEQVELKNYSQANNYDYLSIGILYAKKDILERYNPDERKKILESVSKLEESLK